MTETDLGTAVAALSARTLALEGAIAALSRQIIPKEPVLASFDDFAARIVDRYVGLPVDDAFVDLLEQSFADVRCLLSNTALAVGPAAPC